MYSNGWTQLLGVEVIMTKIDPQADDFSRWSRIAINDAPIVVKSTWTS